MDVLLESLTAEWQNLLRLMPRLVTAIIVLILFVILGRIAARAVAVVLTRGKFSQTHLRFFRGLTVWLLAAVGMIVALNVVGLKGIATSLVAGGGITAVVVGFALRGIGENFLAGFFLAFSRPFEVGDLIQSGDLQGEVRGIELRSTHIRAADGRDIFIPSAQIFGMPLVNFTKDGLRRLSFVLGIDYGDDLGRACSILRENVRQIESVLDDPPSGVNIASLAPQYVELEVFFWIDTFRTGVSFLGIRSAVILRSREVLAAQGFTFSSNVTTNLAVGVWPELDARVDMQPTAAGSGQ